MKYRVSTASGAVHLVDTDELTYRRDQVGVDDGVHLFDTLRRDAEVIRLLVAPDPPVVGQRWLLVLEPLDPEADWTERVTTPVVAVEERS